MSYLITKDYQSKVIHIVYIILLDIDPVHVHQDVSNHDHGCLVIVPSLVQCLKEVVVK